eukprot:CAMPEP_0197855526 /NCGR_PEP_ID=MMETSP1438-20131217/26803_1 /TAXON_ID=1461541 /ORGANISM="Pterosperma sp., Strain CCMP1384" /LENGTH=53 /DNA_ID=CAMNT_0043470671 /DNA_START=413 /DNA_END=574 /DNA_ORIENTATION=+
MTVNSIKYPSTSVSTVFVGALGLSLSFDLEDELEVELELQYCVDPFILPSKHV